MSENILTEKQEAYCRAYVECGNQSAAYRIAYDADAMNVNTVYVEACRLHQTPKITQRIKELREEKYESNKMVANEVLMALAEMVRFDPAEMYDENGALLPIHKMPRHVRQNIESIDNDEMYITVDGKKQLAGQTKKVRTVKRIDAAEKFMRHLGLYKEDNDQAKSQPIVVLNLGEGQPEEEQN